MGEGKGETKGPEWEEEEEEDEEEEAEGEEGIRILNGSIHNCSPLTAAFNTIAGPASLKRRRESSSLNMFAHNSAFSRKGSPGA